MENGKWKVKEKYSDRWGVYLQFNFTEDGDGYELDPGSYFHKEYVDRKRPLHLFPNDIGYHDACRELCKLYGDEWNT